MPRTFKIAPVQNWRKRQLDQSQQQQLSRNNNNISAVRRNNKVDRRNKDFKNTKMPKTAIPHIFCVAIFENYWKATLTNFAIVISPKQPFPAFWHIWQYRHISQVPRTPVDSVGATD